MLFLRWCWAASHRRSGGGGGSLGKLASVGALVDVGLVVELDALLGVEALDVVGLGDGGTGSLGARDVVANLLGGATVHLSREGAAGSSSRGGLGGDGEEGAAGSAKVGVKVVGGGAAVLLGLDGEALAHDGALLGLGDEARGSARVEERGGHLSELRMETRPM